MCYHIHEYQLKYLVLFLSNYCTILSFMSLSIGLHMEVICLAEVSAHQNKSANTFAGAH